MPLFTFSVTTKLSSKPATSAFTAPTLPEAVRLLRESLGDAEIGASYTLIDSPAKTFARDVRALLSAACAVEASWDHEVGTDAYPECLPSFDEFVCDLSRWAEAVDAKAQKEGAL